MTNGGRRRPWVNILLVPAVAATMSLTGCGGSSNESAPTGDSSVAPVASTASAGDEAAIAVCRQVITSAGVMVRDYNAFIKRLNATQNYAQIGTEDRYARETLDTGARLIRDASTPEVPETLADKVYAFLGATEKLSEQIRKKNKLALNKAMTEWGDTRTELLDACGEYMPTGT